MAAHHQGPLGLPQERCDAPPIRCIRHPLAAAPGFNQPLIPVWRTGDGGLNVQLPFTGSSLMGDATQWPIDNSPRSFPARFSLASAQGGLIADIFQGGQQTVAALLSYDSSTPIRLQIGQASTIAPGPFPALRPLNFQAQIGQ